MIYGAGSTASPDPKLLALDSVFQGDVRSRVAFFLVAVGLAWSSNIDVVCFDDLTDRHCRKRSISVQELKKDVELWSNEKESSKAERDCDLTLPLTVGALI